MLWRWGSSLHTIEEIMDGVKCMPRSRDTVLIGKTGKNTPDESSVEMEENLQAEHSQ